MDGLVGDDPDVREEVLEAFVFLGRVLGPPVDLAEVVVEDHAKPDAGVTGLFVAARFPVLVVFFHSVLEFRPVFQDELVQHEGLCDGFFSSLGIWIADGGHGSRLEMVRQCQVE